MNIKSAESTTVHFVETDDDGYTLYTRYSADNWTVRMGESDESVYDCAELEAAFQVFNANVQSEARDEE